MFDRPVDGIVLFPDLMVSDKRSEGNAELALVKLSHLFNHSNPAITRRYLGISKQELLDTYDVLSF